MPDEQSQFVPGQRWVSDTESNLGLGIISDVDARTVTVVFVASEEQRTYARSGAPLSRVRLGSGETVQSFEEWALRIEHVHEHEGLLIYQGVRVDTGEQVQLPESQLSGFLQFTDASSRLLNGQIDPHKWFELRLQTHQALDLFQRSETYGLCGARVSLIAHQLFIANEIANRFAPRALLADEVGLGKTIEACLIVHKQLLTGRARRVLIVVPEPLLHQWLVELVRRFNLYFSVFDEERCAAIRGSDSDANPFDAEQLVLCPLPLFEQHQTQRDALAAGWDMVVVDEAHHLVWDPQQPGDNYRFVEALGASTPGLLLLTATPEQLGEESHFARLRLLDPDRFTSFEAFIQEQTQYRRVSAVVDELNSGTGLSDATRSLVETLTGDSPNADDGEYESRLVRDLIDRHGPSRVLFRNTRSNISGFPRRHVHPFKLQLPTEYQRRAGLTVEQLLYPELRLPHGWTGIDPRVDFIKQQMQHLGSEKMLVICARAQTVVDLESVLRTRHGIHAAIFHQDMSVVARDRAAHFFADPDGSRLLICSEIGSEGRNFQFAHNLILFDLPLNPDLLEQRIGRLDRIGQAEDIQIHIPYFGDSAQEILFRWYHQGINALLRTCPVGQSVFEHTRLELMQQLVASDSPDPDHLVAHTHAIYLEQLGILERGRDRLLEISSYNKDQAIDLVTAIDGAQQRMPVKGFLDRVFDVHGVEFEDRDTHSFIARPGEHMHAAHFPGLKDDGVTLTFDRGYALAHEDVEYVSWEHPLTRGAIDLTISSDLGKAGAVGVGFDLLPPGTVLLECVFVLEMIAPNAPELRRFLAHTVLRVLMDLNGRDLTKLLTSDRLFHQVQDIDRNTIQRLVEAKRDQIATTIKHCTARATTTFNQVIQDGKQNLEREMKAEHRRLAYLKSIRASVREQELRLLEDQRAATLRMFSNAQTRLDAVRVIVTL